MWKKNIWGFCLALISSWEVCAFSNLYELKCSTGSMTMMEKLWAFAWEHWRSTDYKIPFISETTHWSNFVFFHSDSWSTKKPTLIYVFYFLIQSDWGFFNRKSKKGAWERSKLQKYGKKTCLIIHQKEQSSCGCPVSKAQEGAVHSTHHSQTPGYCHSWMQINHFKK